MIHPQSFENEEIRLAIKRFGQGAIAFDTLEAEATERLQEWLSDCRDRKQSVEDQQRKQEERDLKLKEIQAIAQRQALEVQEVAKRTEGQPSLNDLIIDLRDRLDRIEQHLDSNPRKE